jgi:predicted nucleic acid-binding protein
VSASPASLPIAYADTNLFVSLFADGRHPLHETTLALFRRVAEGRLRLNVTSVIVAELFYVASTILGWKRTVTAERIAGLLEADGLVVPEAAVLARACALYGADTRLDFADAYLAANGLEAGPPTVASFDTDLDRIPGIQRLSV